MELITTKELCKKLCVTRQCIYKWRLEGMPYKKYGKPVRFDYKEVVNWLERR